MSYSTLLIDTCDVYRYTEGAQDAYGTPAKTWAVNLDDQACRLSAYRPNFAGKEIYIGAEVVVGDEELFIGVVDIIEQDRVYINSTWYEVIMVVLRQDGFESHHKQCLLRTVR